MPVETTFFLSRSINDFQSGPIIFGTDNNQNSDIIFTTFTPPGLLNSVMVQNAGYDNLNGIFNYVSTLNNKPYYAKSENGDRYIVWENNLWEIYDFRADFRAFYFSNENVRYPWQVTSWTASSPYYDPPPTVSIIF